MKNLLFILCFTIGLTIINAQTKDSLKVEQAIIKDSIAVLQAKADAIQTEIDIVPEGWNTFGTITFLIKPLCGKSRCKL
jgi:hypothetical protein